MPTPKRWFPLSRDFNDDPEVWELTMLFGDRALRIPIEVFGILDRTENEWRLTGQWLAGLSRKVRQQPATVQRVIDWMLAKGWLVADQSTENGSPMILRARNYWKFHRMRGTTGSQSEASVAPPLPNLPLPNLSAPNIHEEKKEIKKRGEGVGGEFSLSTSDSPEGSSNGNGRATPELVVHEWNARSYLRHIPKPQRAETLLNQLHPLCQQHTELTFWRRLFDEPERFTPPGNERPIALRDLLEKETWAIIAAGLEEPVCAGR